VTCDHRDCGRPHEWTAGRRLARIVHFDNITLVQAIGKVRIEEKLRQSDAYRSLVMEKEVADRLALLGWGTTHSCFFKDCETGKLREVDIVARQRWRKKVAQGEKLVRIHVMVECKSARDYHLLFTRDDAKGLDMDHRVYAEWIGWDGENTSRLMAELSTLGISSDDFSGLRGALVNIAYPKQTMSIGEFHFPPPAAPFYSSVFRETNTKNERDLDSSVLWRAGQSVLAAVAGFREETIQYHLGWISGGAELALKEGGNVIDEILSTYDTHSKMIDLYHPAVVIESPLWAVRGSKLHQIKSCRLLRRERTGGIGDWFDVISRVDLDSYLSRITRFYSGRLKRAGARREA
jgi:hypothetical protein